MSKSHFFMRLRIEAALIAATAIAAAAIGPLLASAQSSTVSAATSAPATSAPATATGSVSATATASAPAPTATSGPSNGSCDPYSQICPDANCTGNLAGSAYIKIFSPNQSVFFYAGTPLFVNWSFSSDTNTARFPAKYVSIYYQFDTDNDKWTKWVDVPAGTTNYSAILPNAPARTYNMRLVCDGVDPQGITGNPASCTDPGFPRLSKTTFRMIQQRDIGVAYSDPFPPNDQNTPLNTNAGGLSLRPKRLSSLWRRTPTWSSWIRNVVEYGTQAVMTTAVVGFGTIAVMVT